MNLAARVNAMKGERGIPLEEGHSSTSAAPMRAMVDDFSAPAPYLAAPNNQGPAPEATVTWVPVASPSPDSPMDPSRLASRAPTQTVVMETHDALSKLKEEAVEQLFERMGSRLNDPNMDENALRTLVQQELNSIIEGGRLPLTARERQRLIREVHDDVLGLGPLEALLADKSVTEIMVNGPDKVYVERSGKLTLTPTRFKDEPHLRRVIERIVTRVGRRIDESSPLVDARLEDGSRVNAIIPPLAVSGSTLTIRKFSTDPLKVADLVKMQSLSPEMAELLEACVLGRLNIIVSGGTGTGKTTLLNVMSSYIPETERILTIEDAAELQLKQSHVVTLEARPPNLEGRGRITIRDLVINALRMRPDRIIVGEVRGGEALDMLQAMNTGHDGSLTTLHANSARDSLRRLETMVLMSGMDLPLRAIREQIAYAIDCIVHLERQADGTRKVVQVAEVQGMEGDVILLQDIFVFERTGVDKTGRILGRLKATGIRPGFAEKLKRVNVELPGHLFGMTFEDLARG